MICSLFPRAECMWYITKVTFFFLIRYKLEKEMLILIGRMNETSKTGKVRSIVLSDHEFFFNDRLPLFYDG